MKTAIRQVKLLTYGLVLALTLYNCNSKEIDSPAPFDYTFKELSEVKLKDITPAAPAPVETKEATITESAEALAVNEGLKSLATTGLTSSIRAAAENVRKVVSDEKTEALIAALTPQVLKSFETTGTLDPALQKEMSNIANNPALQAYLPKFTLPEVENKEVTTRQSAPAQDIVVARITATSDHEGACGAAAQQSYNTALQTLNAAKAAQINTINTLYNATVATINENDPNCKKNVLSKYQALLSALANSFNGQLAALAANKAQLGKDYNALRLFYLATYVETVVIYLRLQFVELASCRLSKDAKLAAAQAARDRSLAEINSNYNTALDTLNKNLAKALKTCHNQGGGQ